MIVEEKQSPYMRKIRCTKSIPLTAIDNPEEDEDIQIVNPTAAEANHKNLCPFKMNLQKSEDGRWKVTFLNQYHNHHFKKRLPLFYFLKKQMTDEEIFQDIQEKSVFKTKSEL